MIRIHVRASATFIFTVPLAAPERSPDSIIVAVEAPVNALKRSDVFGYRVSRSWLWVTFTKAATKEDRQAAIDAVNGTVVGGMGLASRYLVQIPVPRDSAGGPLSRARETLNKQAGVADVSANYLDGPVPQYERPRDSAGAFSSWLLTPAAATGLNWAPEKDQAPLAWGCSTGSSNAKIAVVDDGLYHIQDVQANYSADTVFGTTLQPNNPHGTHVSSILAAVGNNGTGIAGMIWHAHLGQFFMYDSVPGQVRNNWPIYNVYAAEAKGYKIINMSFGLAPDSARIATGHPNATDTTAVLSAVKVFQSIIYNAPLSAQPMFVIAAGNNATDAFYDGFTAAKYDTADIRSHSKNPRLSAFASQIIVVAGDSNSTSQASGIWKDRTWQGSNIGALVDVAAPAVRVAALNQFGLIDTVSGTSYAAPQVSGTLGLLLAFNPTDSTADSLSSYIKRGAVDGGWTSGGFPMLNAYRSLRRAARNRSAPLCGNRVFDRNDSVIVQRNDSSTSTDQGLTNFGAHVELGVPHGGSAFYYVTQMGRNGVWYAETWSPTGWTIAQDSTGKGPWYSNLDTTLASVNLQTGRNHDGDSIASWYNSTSTKIGISVALNNSLTPTYTKIGTVTVDTNWNQVFVQYSATQRQLIITVDFSPQGANVYTMPIVANSVGTMVWHSDSAFFGYPESSQDGSEVSLGLGFPNSKAIIWLSTSTWATLRTSIQANYAGASFAAGTSMLRRHRMPADSAL